jgi:hypothetical protein
MEILADIEKAVQEVQRFPDALGWPVSVLAQLRYCAAVVRGEEPPDRLDELIMGRILCRELDGYGMEELEELISTIQADMQNRYLPPASCAEDE